MKPLPRLRRDEFIWRMPFYSGKLSGSADLGMPEVYLPDRILPKGTFSNTVGEFFGMFLRAVLDWN
jgi:hypothetical protein